MESSTKRKDPLTAGVKSGLASFTLWGAVNLGIDAAFRFMQSGPTKAMEALQKELQVLNGHIANPDQFSVHNGTQLMLEGEEVLHKNGKAFTQEGNIARPVLWQRAAHQTTENVAAAVEVAGDKVKNLSSSNPEKVAAATTKAKFSKALGAIKSYFIENKASVAISLGIAGVLGLISGVQSFNNQQKENRTLDDFQALGFTPTANLSKPIMEEVADKPLSTTSGVAHQGKVETASLERGQ